MIPMIQDVPGQTLSLGFARSRPCATAGANWRPYGFHSSWSAGRQDMRAGRMGCRIGRRPGNDCDAPDRYVSSARGHRPAGGGIKHMSWSFLFAPAGIGAVLLTLFAFAWHNLVARGANKSLEPPEVGEGSIDHLGPC